MPHIISMMLLLLLTGCNPEATFRGLFMEPKFEKGQCYVKKGTSQLPADVVGTIHYVYQIIESPTDYISCQIRKMDNYYYACDRPLFGYSYVDSWSESYPCPAGLISQREYDCKTYKYLRCN